MITGDLKDIFLLDVTPLSLGLETIGGVMKTLIPRNTTIPVRRSDIFSTAENNQSQVEVHILQGERQLAEHNKSLGRFQLRGIPPAPRGIPQVQVSFDIDANGILQVSALDRYTGREQSITVQGATNLSESEIKRMMREADDFADTDRRRRERIEKRNRSQDLIAQCDRRLREVNLDFGPQFASNLRRQIESLSRDLLDSLNHDDDRQIDISYTRLQDALYELIREVNQSDFGYDEDDEDLFNLPSMASIKDAVSKGVDAIRGTTTGSSSRRPATSPRYGNERGGRNSSWDDWDDDNW
jgi:molecular chaperone DnaK